MIFVNEFARTIESILNGTYTLTPIVHAITRPSAYFKVRTPFQFLDNVMDESTKENFIPVMIGDSSGEYESIPNANLSDQTFTLYFYFPVELKEQIFSIIEYAGEALVGQYLNFGTSSVPKMAATNMEVASFGQITPQNFGEFEELCSGVFHTKVERTKLYGVMMLPVSVSSGKSSLVFGNAVKYKLSIDGTNYYEVMRFDNSATFTGNPSSQQILNTNYTKTLVDSSVYTQSISFLYDKYNSVCVRIQNAYENRSLQLQDIYIQTSYNGGSTYSAGSKKSIVSIQKVEKIGLPVSYTLTFTDIVE